MQTWAIANQKGGVGKTTTSLCLARGLAADGARVVLIDLDPHASLTRAFAVPTDPPPAGSHDLFNPGGAELRSLARGTAIDGLLLVAAQPALATLERRGATQPGLGLSIGRALHAARAGFDYAVLDCPPTLPPDLHHYLIADRPRRLVAVVIGHRSHQPDRAVRTFVGIAEDELGAVGR